ncbi:hypothetical protein AKJ37_07880 [candidate division MSBL1 archaeon SCGC-AAA259I09]|uniref:RCK C-terminal domain-containing protein n=1 Tax=candidate division MSBL1 archaeon SCGC-AAA259I09 TaxID=1698267 RepID=A0A133UIY1_9EURY|nr:hypothetical protein AKJ37_07880 [candidate division MSBL1 archaeon SCGC-AAA259I09]
MDVDSSERERAASREINPPPTKERILAGPASPAAKLGRIKKLEKEEIIKGYPADINYEKTGNKFVSLFKSSSSVYDREELARKALQVSGVINVRELLTGERDLHIKVAADDTEHITKIARELSQLGIEIEDEDLIQREHFSPYQPFGPEKGEKEPIIDFRRIVGTAETVDLTVGKNSTVIGKTLEEIKTKGLIDKDSLLIAIERDNKTFTPRGDTTIKKGDIVTIFSTKSISNKTLQAFKSAKNQK